MDPSTTRFAFLDLETTGLSPWFGDRICEVGIVLTEGLEVSATYQSLVNPERLLSPGAAHVNGLTAEQLHGAPHFAEIAREVLGHLEGRVVVCHNAPFDLQFLDSELRRMGREVEIAQLIDSLKMARRVVKAASYKLSVLAESLQVSPGQAHRALGDAETDRLVFQALLGLASSRGETMDDFLERYSSPHQPDESIVLPAALSEAIASGRRLTITYMDGSGEETKRSITPIKVIGLTDYIYLKALCHLRNDERSFRLDRIKEMHIEA